MATTNPKTFSVRSFPVIFLALSIGVGSAPAQEQPKDKPGGVTPAAGRWERVPKLIQEYVYRRVIAGGVVLVMHRGKPVCFAAVGMADAEAKTPMARDAIFREELVGIVLTQLYPFDHLTLWKDFQEKVYQDLKESKVPVNEPPSPPLVRVSEVTIHGDMDCFKVETPSATYVYGKKGAGFASLLDKDGRDWISYRPDGKAKGEYRGLPKCGQPTKFFHCGYGYGQYRTDNVFVSKVAVRAAEHVRIDSETLDKKSACTWDFYPTHATLTLLRIDAPTFWFLYEGTPGGRLDPAKDFALRPDGRKSSLDEAWSGVVPWVCFGSGATSVGFVCVNHQEPEKGQTDSYVSWPFEKDPDGSFQEMTVFGFGRKGYKELVQHVPDLTGLPARYSIGFIDNAEHATAKALGERLRRTPAGSEAPVDIPKPAVKEALEPWASNRHPQDVTRQYTEEIAAANQAYRVTQGGTMDGSNCRSPIAGSFGVWDQSWESNRTVRMENIGDAEVINPWLSNGRNDFRTLKEMVAGALLPGMTEREKAIALWRLQTTHRFHATTNDAEVNDPVKVFNVYGYTTCGDDSICLAGLWRTAGFPVRPARVVGHCITQVHYDGRWNLLDGDMGPFYLLRDNATIAGERDLVRDHDLLKRTHTHGILDADSRADAEWSAALFVYEGEAGGDRNAPRDTTMNMVLRPNEALMWRWGHRVPLKYHGRADLTVWGPRAADRVCNGRWEYRPDFTREAWRPGADAVKNVRAQDGELVAEAGKTGVLVWKMRSPYVFVGGRLDVEGTAAKFALSWDGNSWQEVGENLDALFPANGPPRYEYQLRCELPEGARLKRLAIVNDLQMAPLALPGMVVGENRFTYTDQSTGPRRVRLTHEWVERSVSRPPGAPPDAVFPADGGRTDGSDLVFQWRPPQDPESDGIADYHFELSERPDVAWPLSSNFSKLVSNTADRGQPRFRVPYTGLLTPGREYYWRVRARNGKGVWGPWSKAWSFTPGGPAQPVEVDLEPAKEAGGKVILRWKPNAAGRKPVKYRVYGSDEKGFSVSDEPFRRNVGQSKEVPAQAPANFVAETSDTELVVLGAGVDRPNANRAFYRVVAVDDQGKRSGPSDYVAAARPFIYSRAPEAAQVGGEFRYQVSAIRSLGDLRLRVAEGKEVASFWDIEKPRFEMVQGPTWLRLDESTGVLRGVPDAVGNREVVVKVTLERPVRRLDEGRLSWGQELVKEVGTEPVGSTTQRFRIAVGP